MNKRIESTISKMEKFVKFHAQYDPEKSKGEDFKGNKFPPEAQELGLDIVRKILILYNERCIPYHLIRGIGQLKKFRRHENETNIINDYERISDYDMRYISTYIENFLKDQTWSYGIVFTQVQLYCIKVFCEQYLKYYYNREELKRELNVQSYRPEEPKYIFKYFFDIILSKNIPMMTQELKYRDESVFDNYPRPNPERSNVNYAEVITKIGIFYGLIYLIS